MGGPLGVPVSQQLADTSGGCPPQYPPDITWSQSLECAFLPFSDTCVALKNVGQSQCRALAIGKPATVSPPVVDTTPGSPTYGQAIGPDGQVVSSAAQAAALLNDQIADADAATKASVMNQVQGTAATLCQQLRVSCGLFTSANADCTECVFDATNPLFLLLVFGIGALLISKPWK